MEECLRCARCCEEITFPVEGDAEWIRNFSEFLQITRPKTFELVDGCLRIWIPCVHLQPDNRCDIYADRPRICRDFICQRMRARGGADRPLNHFQ